MTIGIKRQNREIAMLGALELAEMCLRLLSEHPAFSDDAPEFNKGGVGYETLQFIRDALRR